MANPEHMDTQSASDGMAYVADEYLLEAEQSNYNFKADTEAALLVGAAIETGKDMTYALSKEQKPNPIQQKAIDAYSQAVSNTQSGNSMDVVVTKATMEALDAESITKTQQSLLKSMLSYSADSISVNVKTAKNAYEHYAKSAKELQTDLTALKQQLKAAIDQNPRRDFFEFGAYSRFFQAAGKPLDSFGAYGSVLKNLQACVQFAQYSGMPLAESTSRICLNALRQMQNTKRPFTDEEYEDLVERIRDDTLDVWKNAAADTPQMYSREYTATVPGGVMSSGKTRGAITALFDNHMLCWLAPEGYVSVKPNAPQRVDFFGAEVVRDPSLDKKGEKGPAPNGMDIPSNDALIKALDDAIAMLSVVQRYSESVNRLDGVGSELKSSLKALNALLGAGTPNIAMKNYVPLAMASVQAHIQPHVKLIWLAIRSSIMLAAIAETSVLADLETGKYASVARKTTNKIIVKLDLDIEPEKAAAKEMGYYTSLLLKLKKS